MTDHWPKIYYDALEFYYWEPQHLGKIKNPKTRHKTADSMRRNLAGMEVSLNHIMNLFMKLLPNSFLLDFFSDVFERPIVDEFRLLGREVEKLYGVGNLIQPDMFFLGRNNLVNIELKIKAKSDLKQYGRYVCFQILERLASGKTKDYHLLFMGPGSFSNLWLGRISTTDDLKRAFGKFDLAELAKKAKLDLGQYEADIRDVAETMKVAFLSYQDFGGYIRKLRKRIDRRSPYADVMVELLDGMLGELGDRKLIDI